MNLGDPGIASAWSDGRRDCAGRASTEEECVAHLPVPGAELTALSGTYDSDEGLVEIFARDGKLRYRIPDSQIEGALLRQAENVYAITRTQEGLRLWNSSPSRSNKHQAVSSGFAQKTDRDAYFYPVNSEIMSTLGSFRYAFDLD